MDPHDSGHLAEIGLSRRSFGKYLLHERVGEGGMSIVYRAEHLFLRRTVALKIASRTKQQDPRVLPHFERSAALAARLDHPAIAKVYDVDKEKGVPYLVLEYVQGRNLGDLITGGVPWSPRRKVLFARDVALALHHAHGRGVIHGDLKPGNLLVTPAGAIKVIDFGCEQLPKGIITSYSGAQFATPHYMAPEQASGVSPDVQSDIYSLGITLFCLLTGLAPFRGASPKEVLLRISEGGRPYRTEDWARLPRTLVPLLASLTANSPKLRPASAKEAAQRLTIASAKFLPPGRGQPRRSSMNGPTLELRSGGLKNIALNRISREKKDGSGPL